MDSKGYPERAWNLIMAKLADLDRAAADPDLQADLDRLQGGYTREGFLNHNRAVIHGMIEMADGLGLLSEAHLEELRRDIQSVDAQRTRPLSSPGPRVRASDSRRCYWSSRLAGDCPLFQSVGRS